MIDNQIFVLVQNRCIIIIFFFARFSTVTKEEKYWWEEYLKTKGRKEERG